MKLLKYELKKLLQFKVTMGILAVFTIILFGLFSTSFFSGQISGYSSNPIHGKEAAMINKEIAESHSGYLTDDLIRDIFDDYARRQPELKKKGVYNVFEHMTIYQFVKKPTDMLEKINSSSKVLHFKNIKLLPHKALGSTLPLNQLKHGNFAPWNQLYSVLDTVYMVIILTTLFICAPIFSGDYENKMNSILLNTKLGRNKLTLTKFITCFLSASCIFVLSNSIVLVVFGQYFTWSGWDTSVQLNLYWINHIFNMLSFPIHLNLRDVLLLLLLYQYIGLLFISGIGILVSSLTRKPLVNYAISVLLYFAPEFLLKVFQDGIVNKLLTCLSINTSELDGLLLKYSNMTSSGFFFENFWVNGIITLLIKIIILILALRLTYLNQLRRES